MVELASFLASLGLSQYIRTFADNDIDGLALLELEETHLKELGLSLGHRVRLMKAIAELRLAGFQTPASVASNLPLDAAVNGIVTVIAISAVSALSAGSSLQGHHCRAVNGMP